MARSDENPQIYKYIPIGLNDFQRDALYSVSHLISN